MVFSEFLFSIVDWFIFWYPKAGILGSDMEAISFVNKLITSNPMSGLFANKNSSRLKIPNK